MTEEKGNCIPLVFPNYVLFEDKEYVDCFISKVSK